MNQATLEKLKKNKHYKMSAKQKEEAEKVRPMVEIGRPQFTNGPLEKHPTLKRRKA